MPFKHACDGPTRFVYARPLHPTPTAVSSSTQPQLPVARGAQARTRMTAWWLNEGQVGPPLACPFLGSCPTLIRRVLREPRSASAPGLRGAAGSRGRGRLSAWGVGPARVLSGVPLCGGEEAAFHAERGQLSGLVGVPGVQDKLSTVPAASSHRLCKPGGRLTEKR